MIIQGNALKIPLKDNSVHLVVTSPPYWGLRNYGVDGQLGLEKTPEEYVENMVKVFREVWRVLRDDGTLFLNIGDSYASGKGTCHNPGGNTSSFNVHLKAANVHPLDRGNKSTLEVSGLKPKDLVGIPWAFAFALRNDGWYLRSDIIWSKPNPMPESVTDRPTKSHEYIFLLTKSQKYYFDQEAVRERTTADPKSCGKNSRKYQDRDPNHPSDRKTSALDPNDGQRRIVDHVARARANGMPHDNPFGISRNIRTVWTIATQPFPGAHFATFPEKLVEPCIKAGTSEKGCCPKCGEPWVRVVEKTGERISTHWAPGTDRKTELAKGRHGETSVLTSGYQFVYITSGWQPSCSCGLDPVPCVVLDPFAGSGTVGRVALRLRRKAVLIDLKTDYLKMAEKRTTNLQVELI